jgi:hypothetical protein
VSEQQPDPADGGAQSFADPAIDGIPAVVAASPEASNEIPTSVGKRSGRRTAWAVALGLGYVVLAAGTAFGVIAGKSPAPVDVTAVDASAYAAPAPSTSVPASANTSTNASTKASASASAGAVASTTTVAPTPKSTVTGSVSNGVHSGDLRYFLLPPPQGPSSVQGNPDGNSDTLDETIASYDGDSSQRSILQQAGFKEACDRIYQDTTIGANVSILLIRFDSSSDAAQWLDSFGLSGASFASISVPGVSGAKGWSYAKDGGYRLVGLYREGDTFYEIQAYGTQLIPAPVLGRLISAEHSRLAKG